MLNVVVAILKVTHCLIGSQCSSAILVRTVLNNRSFCLLKFLFRLVFIFFKLKIIALVRVKRMVTSFVFVLVLVTKIALC